MTIPGFKVGWTLVYLFLMAWGGGAALQAELFEVTAKHPKASITGTISGEYTLDSQRLIVRVKQGRYTWRNINGEPRKKMVQFKAWLMRWKEDRNTVEYLASSESVKINKTVENNETLSIGTYKLIIPVQEWTAEELGQMWLAISITDSDTDTAPGVSWETHVFVMRHYLFREEAIDFSRIDY
ncbi:MAG: hypothetical protein B9S32_17060 [Verrucomicrobia bacterium Tous-C9LFEB]|nr:MAG: hypothetical protein B9S32_17060 [Verrucomicrobia bacterium Tous-C9LFEB]